MPKNVSIKDLDIIKVAKKVFKKSDINIKSNAKTVQNWDSMNHIILIMEINKKFKINISLEDSIKIDSIINLSKTIKKYKNAK
tara:strand:- start:803 stop:1051 length:249 start_codon:yes stop_codon:yes gene_type:complete